jgi:chromosome segregation ATPase
MVRARKKTDEVLASAQRELKAQLAVVREELGRLTAEERALTEALSTLDTKSTSGSSAAARSATAGSAPKRRTRGRRRRARGASKSTAERLQELQALLADGPKSRNDLAAALKVSPPRVQQLLAELGSAVTSRPDPGQRQGKLWSLSNGAKSTATKIAPVRKASAAK